MLMYKDVIFGNITSYSYKTPPHHPVHNIYVAKIKQSKEYNIVYIYIYTILIP